MPQQTGIRIHARRTDSGYSLEFPMHLAEALGADSVDPRFDGSRIRFLPNGPHACGGRDLSVDDEAAAARLVFGYDYELLHDDAGVPYIDLGDPTKARPVPGAEPPSSASILFERGWDVTAGCPKRRCDAVMHFQGGDLPAFLKTQYIPLSVAGDYLYLAKMPDAEASDECLYDFIDRTIRISSDAVLRELYPYPGCDYAIEETDRGLRIDFRHPRLAPGIEDAIRGRKTARFPDPLPGPSACPETPDPGPDSGFRRTVTIRIRRDRIMPNMVREDAVLEFGFDASGLFGSSGAKLFLGGGALHIRTVRGGSSCTGFAYAPVHRTARVGSAELMRALLPHEGETFELSQDGPAGLAADLSKGVPARKADPEADRGPAKRTLLDLAARIADLPEGHPAAKSLAEALFVMIQGADIRS